MMRPGNCYLYRPLSTDVMIDGRVNLTQACYHADRDWAAAAWLLNHYGIAMGDAIAFACYDLDSMAAIFFEPLGLTDEQAARLDYLGGLPGRRRG